MSVRGQPVAIIDTETTGLISGFHELIEVAIIRIEGSTREEGLFRFRPTFPDRASSKALEINGWRKDRWASLPHPMSPIGLEHYGSILKMVRGCYVIGHNVEFDLGFLRDHMSTHNRQQWAIAARERLSRPKIRGAIDTIALSWLALGSELDRLSLDHIRERYPQIQTGEAHTALSDARTVERLIKVIDPTIFGRAL